MEYLSTAAALRLTGLNKAVLREWTVRRGLIPPDRPAAAQGSPAGFKWQTILVLRLARVLRDEFRVELQSHAVSMASYRASIANASPAALRNLELIIAPGRPWEHTEPDRVTSRESDRLTLRLGPHIDALADDFGFRTALEACNDAVAVARPAPKTDPEEDLAKPTRTTAITETRRRATHASSQ